MEVEFKPRRWTSKNRFQLSVGSTMLSVLNLRRAVSRISSFVNIWSHWFLDFLVKYEVECQNCMCVCMLLTAAKPWHLEICKNTVKLYIFAQDVVFCRVLDDFEIAWTTPGTSANTPNLFYIYGKPSLIMVLCWCHSKLVTHPTTSSVRQ